MEKYILLQEVSFVKTTNGGSNWVALSSGTYQILNSVYFTDANTGYTVGDVGTILKTTNGGYPVGLTELSSKSHKLNIYPNPAYDKITIETSADLSPKPTINN